MPKENQVATLKDNVVIANIKSGFNGERAVIEEIVNGYGCNHLLKLRNGLLVAFKRDEFYIV